jgi:hypothetical protein
VVDWKSYNDALVRRGEVILDFDVIDNWKKELNMMNYGKRGATYLYPNSFVQLLGHMRVYFHLPYRQTEGVVRTHAGDKVPSIPDYSTINKLDIKIHEHVGNDIVLALDSTGIKVANRGEWMQQHRHKWHIRKGYLKIHVAVDIKKKKILSLEVTSEEVHDGRILMKLVDNVCKNNHVKRTIGDGSYDSNANFQYLLDKNIDPAIRVRKNSSIHNPTIRCQARNKAVIYQLKE